MLPLYHGRVVPALIVRVDGLNASAFVIHTLDPAGVHVPPPPPPPPYGAVEPPHAASSTTPAAPNVRIIRLDRMDPPRWRVRRLTVLSRMLTTLRNARDLSENDEAFGQALVALALQCVGREAG